MIDDVRRLAAGLALACGLALHPAAAGEPYRPADDGLVLERLPAGIPARAAAPADPAAAALQARTYIEQARREGDPRFLGYAERVLRPWWPQVAPPAPVLLMRATLRQSRHDFDGALRDLERLLDDNPHDAQALLTRATILRVQGRAVEAIAPCVRLRGLADPLYARLCEAAARGLSGELRRAAAALDALDLGRAGPELRAWWVAERADMARRLGHPEQALRLYAGALAGGIEDPQLVAAACELLIEAGRPQEALRLAGAGPRAELLRLRRAQAARAAGAPEPALEAALAESFERSRRRGEDQHLREEARFELSVRGDAGAALRLARDNWRTQREPGDALLLAQAALAAGDRGALDELRRWRDGTRLEDAQLAGLLRAPTP